jgi:hypothetical protein
VAQYGDKQEVKLILVEDSSTGAANSEVLPLGPEQLAEASGFFRDAVHEDDTSRNCGRGKNRSRPDRRCPIDGFRRRGGDRDARPRTRRRHGERAKDKHHYRDYRDLVADPDVDVVHACTPNSSHFEICKAAIVAGKAVLCEKPLTISAKESEELLALAISRNVKTAVIFVYRHYAAIQALRDIISRGRAWGYLHGAGEYLRIGCSTTAITTGGWEFRRRSFPGHGRHRLPLVRFGLFPQGEKIVEVCAGWLFPAPAPEAGR